MSIKITPMNQCLEKKLLIFGFEIPEILVIFFTLAVLNFIFGATSVRLFLVWIPTAILALVLRVGKRGKPDNYLNHFIKFNLQKKYLSAFAPPTLDAPPPSLDLLKLRGTE